MGFFKDLFKAIKEGLEEPIEEQKYSSIVEISTNDNISKDDRFDQLADSIKDNTLFNRHNHGSDLVVFHDYGGGCCETCAKFRGRVYSISGNNAIFPKLPEYAKVHGNFHEGCRCTMSPYFDEDEIFYKGETKNAITISNRSWVDDRTDEEVKKYQDYLNMLEKEEQKKFDKEEYEQLLKIIPEYAPKSFGAYRRMKNGKTKRYEELRTLAKEKGIIIEE